MFTVITDASHSIAGEVGNLYNGGVGFNVFLEKEDSSAPFGTKAIPIVSDPRFKTLALELFVPNFRVGEILVLDYNGRDHWGRKPSKWDVQTESFDTFEQALERAKKAIKEWDDKDLELFNKFAEENLK